LRFAHVQGVTSSPACYASHRTALPMESGVGTYPHICLTPELRVPGELARKLWEEYRGEPMPEKLGRDLRERLRGGKPDS
jgi:hypothetical protein